MEFYTVHVVSANHQDFVYTCLALSDKQAVSLAVRHHNRTLGGTPEFHASIKHGKVMSNRRLRAGVVNFDSE